MIGLVACVVALGGSAAVQGATGPSVTQAPTITGTQRVGQTLTATGGHWTGPSGTTPSYPWLRRTDPRNVYSCSIPDNQTSQTDPPPQRTAEKAHRGGPGGRAPRKHHRTQDLKP